MESSCIESVLGDKMGQEVGRFVWRKNDKVLRKQNCAAVTGKTRVSNGTVTSPVPPGKEGEQTYLHHTCYVCL